MLIWTAILVPIAAIVYLRWRYARSMALWEYGLVLIVPIIAIALGKFCADKASVMDTEYWGGILTKADYYEPWDEEVPCTHVKYRTETYTYSCGDSKSPQTCTGTREVFDGYEHAYDVDYHPAKWQIDDSNGVTVDTNKADFERLSSLFKSRVFVDMHRSYHSIDGDAYEAIWPGDRTTLQPVTTSHTYENRVAVSHSIHSYPEVDPKKTMVFEYPQISGYNSPSVLSFGRAWPHSEEIDKNNAEQGARKKVRVNVVIWQDANRQVAFDQEAYWKGGNKNELVICVSTDKAANVQWCRVFSWSTVESLKTDIESYLAVDHPVLDFATFAPWLKEEVESKWQKRNWHDFDYLSVEPPVWAQILVWVFTIGTTIGVSLYCIGNQHSANP